MPMRITPARVMTGLVAINFALIFFVVRSLQYHPPKNFSLYSVSIQQPPKTEQLVSEKPIRIVVPSLGIDLPVEDGIYNNKTKEWTLSDTAVHYALVTPQPNNLAGNTFIYGHNKQGIFDQLKNLKLGETVELHGEKTIFRYVLKTVHEVSPEDVSLFSYTGPSQLTIQTCSGTWYEKRQLFTLSFQEVIVNE